MLLVLHRVSVWHTSCRTLRRKHTRWLLQSSSDFWHLLHWWSMVLIPCRIYTVMEQHNFFIMHVPSCDTMWHHHAWNQSSNGQKMMRFIQNSSIHWALRHDGYPLKPLEGASMTQSYEFFAFIRDGCASRASASNCTVQHSISHWLTSMNQSTMAPAHSQKILKIEAIGIVGGLLENRLLQKMRHGSC
jgi:hypothetical protein